MTVTDADLVQAGNILAESLDLRGAADSAGVVRKLARRVHELRQHAPIDIDVCDCGCGESLDQPATGRRRRYVDDAHRKRHVRKQSAKC